MPSRSWPRITVITPNLNHGRYLERTICSVLDQGYENLEYIVYDGGSEDESVPLIRHYDDQITMWRSRRNAGPADAINQAIEHASGQLVCIVMADNLLMPGALHAAAQCAAHDTAAWFVGQGRRIGDHDQHLGWLSTISLPSLETLLRKGPDGLPLATTFFRRSLFDLVGPFDNEFRHTFGYEMSCRLMTAEFMPTIMSHLVAAQREPSEDRAENHTLARGREHLLITERYADALADVRAHEVEPVEPATTRRWLAPWAA